MQRPTWPRVAAAVALVATAPFVSVKSASAGAGMSATSGYAGDAVAAGSSVDTTIEIQNLNTPPDEALTLGVIFLIPSCGTTGPVVDNCPAEAADPGAIDATSALGAEGSSCEGTEFELTPSDESTGRVELAASSPIILASPDDTCRVSVSLEIRRMPSVDSRPGMAGVQTDGFASATGTTSGGVAAIASGGGFFTVEAAGTEIATRVVDESVPVGQPVADSASLAGGADPTGDISFELYGPDDEDCGDEPVATSTVDVDGAGTYTSPAALPDEPGEYRYIARYSGDDNNLPAAGECNDPNEAVLVTAAEPPGIQVVYTANPLSRPEPGGTFAFDVVVTNTSAVAITLTDLVDDVYGDISVQGTCTDAVGTTLAPGDSYTCAFAGELTGNAGTTQTSEVTVSGADEAGTTVSDDDDATIALTDLPPTVDLDKSAITPEQAAPGGLFTFGVTVTNTSAEPVTITSLVDDAYGDLADLTSSTCAELVGATLDAGEERTCTFTGSFTGEAGGTHTNVLTVTVTDDEGTTGTAQDDATIRLVETHDQTPTPSSSTTSTTRAPSTATTGRRPTPSTPTLAKTGDRTRTLAAQGFLLVGAGLVLTGLGQGRPARRVRTDRP